MAPPMKPDHLRARTNKPSTSASLRVDSPLVKFELPTRAESNPWHPRTKEWWDELWASPMSEHYVRMDWRGLVDLAELEDQYNYTPTHELLSEIRLQRACFGLTPLDRRRLGWSTKKRDELDDDKPVEATKKADVKSVLAVLVPKGAR